ncbi:RHS repeat-associated core domain-containing protein, partial [Chryseobacterium proteolyticum]
GNRLSKVAEASQNSSGYPYFATPNEITYDNNGNMTSHKDKDITKIGYNYLNLPNSITNGIGKFSTTNSYLYRADGVKLKKSLSGSLVIGINQTEYLDGFQYNLVNGEICTGCTPPSPILQFIPTSEGYYDFVKNKYIYNYTDHLGNIRLSYQKGTTGIEVIEENNYYPFGLKHEGYNGLAGNPAYQYKYNGKELQETGMYDYGARMYMPEIGRWGVIDPLAEKFHSYSPYNYVMNDPIANYDPDGMDVKNDYKLLQNGQVRLIRETNDNSDTLYATDKNGKVDNSKSVTVAKAKASDSSIIGDLATGGIPDNTMHYTGSRKAFPLGVNRARTTDASDASNVFLFAANNSNVEWGLAGYNTGKTMTYALWTGHSEDTTPNSVLYQGISKLSFEIHTHPGSVTFPTPVNSMTEGDYGSAAWIDSEFAKNRNYPRHFLYSQQDKHLWEYNYYNETSAKFYPGRPGVNKPMPINSKINLKTLRK